MRKTSTFAWFGYSLDINERLRLIKQSGFDGVMLWWGDEHIDTNGPNGAISLEVEQGRHEKYRDIPAEEFLSMALSGAKKLV